MRFYDTSFFVDKEDNPPLCHISQPSGFDWPYTIKITSSDETYGGRASVTFHIHSEAQLVRFKNSVIAAYENFRKEAHNNG